MRLKYKTFRKGVAWLLLLAILLQSMPIYAQELPEETSWEVQNEKDSQEIDEKEDIKTEEILKEGAIRIYHLKQLQAIGTGNVVTTADKEEKTFGTGEPVMKDGKVCTYAEDAEYALMNEIELDSEEVWTLPENFTGSFGQTPKKDAKLYDEKTDTVSIYNNYQLSLLASEHSEKEPIMSNDMIPDKVGMGKFLYADGTAAKQGQKVAQDYLTYSKEHRYVLSTEFTEQMPKLQAQAAADDVVWLDGEQADGRTEPGQLFYEKDGKKYILIGNESQLRAIGSDKHVTPRLYVYTPKGSLVGLLGQYPSYTPYYPGDADLGLKAVAPEGGTTHKEGVLPSKDVPDKVNQDYYSYYKKKSGSTYTDKTEQEKQELADIDLSNSSLLGGILDLIGGILGAGLKESTLCGVDKTGKPNNETAGTAWLQKEYGNLKYSSDADYIIFRNIDLSANGANSNKKDDDWSPIHFSGTMEGKLNLSEGAAPTISNINVNQTGQLNLETTSGIGFFGTISNKTETTGFGSAGTTEVKNLHLDQVKVNNQSTEVNADVDSLIEGVLGILGGLLGGVLDLLNPIVGSLNLKDVVRELLELKKNSPDLFAAGSFAGRIVGDVSVENCRVTGASVTSEKGITGGFVGYTEGATKYDGLSGILGTAVKTLAGLLNVIPGIGLGDLITVLLENDVPLGQLIPTGYYNPSITGCSVALSSGNIGKDTQDYNGGFVGIQIGTKISRSSVSGLNRVQAKNGAGGFAGIERDAVIKGLLNDAGAQLYTLNIRSEQTDCSVSGSNIRIGTQESYAGGFNGVMANSTSRDSQINTLAEVTAKKYAGGYTGRATIGYGTAVGGEDEKNHTLLNSVSGLLSKLVSPGNEDKLNTLLSISGAAPSEIHGCTVTGSGLTIESADYAGGMIGQGDGVKITKDGSSFGGKISGIVSVKAENYTGGIAGSVSTADAIGVINNAVGVGQYIPFEISDTVVKGESLTIQAEKKYAAGGAGLMLGGNVQSVSIDGISAVTAGNYAGGFAGRTGTGSLASTGGLDILGLVEVDNLLSLADGIRVEISDSSVVGIKDGYTVTAHGSAKLTDGESLVAGGFLGEAVGTKIEDSQAENVKEVKAGEKEKDEKERYAGGFVGRSHTGGLAGLAQEEDDGSLKLPSIVQVDSLLKLVPYLLPEYLNTKVSFVTNGENPQVEAQSAGGYAGAMQSGTVDNSKSQEAYAVYGLEKVKGEDYAGGFAGRVEAGAAASSDGLKLLNGIADLNLDGILSALDIYIPQIQSAGVKSEASGFTVEAEDKVKGSAGGYLGYGSGVQISGSDVTSLKHTKVTPPSDSLESIDGSSYFTEASEYAVKGGKYAGGYLGCGDIDSAAAVGGGLALLKTLELSNVLSALDTVMTKIEDSDVNGSAGGFSVLADGTDRSGNSIGKAGGFAGELSGTEVKQSHVNSFAYIIGQEMAGGYVGVMEPGNVASVLENSSVLDGVLNIKDNLANLVQSFIPIIEDCRTSSVPCGGAVRADRFMDAQMVRGIAGGYVGYNHGGRIVGTNEECAVDRLRSVYGGEFAGGFTGLMENANLADTGNLELLFGLLSTSNVLSLLGAVYPTQTNTAVYGPLRNVNMDTWNAWTEVVGKNGVYGYQLPSEEVSSQKELDALIKKYAYGYNVKAGRREAPAQSMQAGTAGGYVGRMQGGIVTEAHAWDSKNVTAYESAGGFAGEMLTAGAAEVGQINLLGLPITSAISAVQTFVPVIRNSDSTGFQSGLTVKATGVSKEEGTLKMEKIGYSGGFVGHMVGGQIWGNWEQSDKKGKSATDAKPDSGNDRCFIANLRKVEGTKTVGGFAGTIDPASAAALDTAGSSGLLGGLLQNLITAPGDLASLLNATISTVRGSDVKAWDEWGISINGTYTDESQNTQYAKAAGGFAGEIKGAVIGEQNQSDSGVGVEKIRSVTGGEHAGGFFGLADVSAVAEITGDGDTSILGELLSLGSADVLDAFRTYIYSASVTGPETAGLEVRARDSKKKEYKNDTAYTGNAGGFGGTLLNGSVKDSSVVNLRSVKGQNYSGGFIGHLGKSGVVDVDELGIFGKVADVGVGILDVFGSHVNDSKVKGMTGGFTVKSYNSINGQEKSEIAGGFAGYADLARMTGNTVKQLKQVASRETAGGFAGQTSFAYLADIKGDSALVNTLLGLLNKVLKALWVQDLEKGQVIKIDLGLLTVDALYDGNLVHLNLLGLDISIALAKEQQLATVYIGDSKIELNCQEDGSFEADDEKKNEIALSLIKANRTKIDGCTVTGISDGYDVYGGDAGNTWNGAGEKGYAGGFVGFNNEGLLKNNQMVLADVIRGTKGKTGPFTGAVSLDSNWDFNTVSAIEGENNQYRIYREPDAAYSKILGKNGNELQDNFQTDPNWNIYIITHMTKGKVETFADLQDAVMSNGTLEKELTAYREDGAMAVLMKDTPTQPTEPGDKEEEPDVQDPCKDKVELRVRKIWKNDSEEERPKEIILHITRTYEADQKTVLDETFQKEIIMNDSNSQSEDIWEGFLSGEEYTAYHVGNQGEKYYYTYHVSEDRLDGYETSVTYQGDYQYGMTITNKKNWFDSLLPAAGGIGTKWLLTIGGLLLAVLAVSAYRKRKGE